MRWGMRKPHNPSSSSSYKSSFMSNIFPASWLSKLKQKKSNQQDIPRKVKGTEKRNSPCIYDYATNRSLDRLCSEGNGEFWKQPFGDDDDDIGIKKGGEILRSALYNSVDEHGFPCTSCRTCRSKCTEFEGKEDIHSLEDMVSRMTRRRRRRGRRETPTQVKIFRTDSEIESRTLRSKYKENGKIRNLGKKVLEKKGFKPERKTDKARRSLGKNMLKQEEDSGIRKNGRDKTKLTSSRKHRSRSFSLGSIEENHVLSSMKAEESDELDTVGIEMDSNWERIKELKSRYERKRQPLCIRKDPIENNPKGRRKIRVYSPRTGTKIELCKIKALEDMKKVKLKLKKKVRESTGEDETDLESFAVVKSSFDPQQDFRDSMVEMIMERRISKAEELEELLACYLTLNSDQYHDLIIKVFRQVWFDLNRASLESELHKQFSCNMNNFFS